MIDLGTTYLGLRLKNPIVPSASPLSRRIDDIRAMEDAGAAAVVLYSLFEEQFDQEARNLDHMLSQKTHSLTDALRYFRDSQEYVRDPDGYVEHVRLAKEAVDVPIIASMNGTSKGGWLDYSRQIEQAGADALELNIYFLPIESRLFGLDLETLYLDILRSVKKQLSIPVAVKLSPFFTALPNFVDHLADAGAGGIVLFNRFYQPAVDIGRRTYVPELTLSTPGDQLLPLRWIAIIYGEIDASLALTSGVHSGEDVLKAVMAGADIVQVCSVLLQKGIGYIGTMLDELRQCMQDESMGSIEEVKGLLSLSALVEPAAYVRASYIDLLHSYQLA